MNIKLPFLEKTAATLELSNVTVLEQQAEFVPQKSFDLVSLSTFHNERCIGKNFQQERKKMLKTFFAKIIGNYYHILTKFFGERCYNRRQERSNGNDTEL